MTRPSAPVLTSDYYTYSTYSQREDFYGGFEPKNDSNTVGYHPNAGPARMEPVISKNKSRKEGSEETASAHCITFIYLALALIVIVFNCYIYYHGIKNKVIYYICATMLFVVMASLLMHIGIARRQPFYCILFVVCRTMEAFACICFIAAFLYSIFDTNNNFYNFFLDCTKFMTTMLPPHYQINVIDGTYQLCVIGLVFSLILLSVTIYVCRVSFECLMCVADQFRAKRMQRTYDTSRVRIASDEFYCT